MTLAERVIFERQHGKGSAPAPLAQQPESLEDLRSDVLSRQERNEAQRVELDDRMRRVSEETAKIELLKRETEETVAYQPFTAQSSKQRTGSRFIATPPIGGIPPKSVNTGKQYCVSPVFALKRFFTDWTTTGRSSRSELWWVMLFVQMPLMVLEGIVGDTDLLAMVGVVELILLWPLACLEGRRFHDFGWPAAVGVIIVLLRVGAAAAAGYYGDSSPHAYGGGLFGLILLLANLAESRPPNKYGPVPNTR